MSKAQNYPTVVPGYPVPEAGRPGIQEPPKMYESPIPDSEVYYKVQHEDKCCGCGVELTLFILGWACSLLGFGPLLWYIGAFLPCCSRGMMRGNSRCGWVANVVMASIVTTLWIIALSTTVYVNTVAMEDFLAEASSDIEFMN